MVRRERFIACAAHCAKCGRHFATDDAFYAHRRGKANPKLGERKMHCVDPEDAADRKGRDLFTVLTEDGHCNVFGPLRTDVVIWTLARKPRKRR